MKKVFLLAAMAVFALGMSAAEAYKSSKLTDNMYISLQGGVYTPFYNCNVTKDVRPVVRLAVNKYFNTVMGVSVYGEAFINNNNGNAKDYTSCNYGKGNKTVVDFHNVGINALANLSNLFAGYAGQPRLFEVVAEAGIGWGYLYGNEGHSTMDNSYETTNLALNFNFNLSNKLQINLRPALQYQDGYPFWYLNRRCAVAQLTAGVSYNLGDVFTPVVPRDQAEIDGLNGKINSLRGELDAKNNALKAAQNEINALKDKLANQKPAPVVEAKDKSILQPSVVFKQGKSNVETSQMPQVEMVAKYMKNHADAKILIEGYASPEGKAELNQKLSEARAEAVKNVLVKKYKVAADRISTKGCGVTDKLFDEYDFNRVSIFKDTTK